MPVLSSPEPLGTLSGTSPGARLEVGILVRATFLRVDSILNLCDIHNCSLNLLLHMLTTMYR